MREEDIEALKINNWQGKIKNREHCVLSAAVMPHWLRKLLTSAAAQRKVSMKMRGDKRKIN